MAKAREFEKEGRKFYSGAKLALALNQSIVCLRMHITKYRTIPITRYRRLRNGTPDVLLYTEDQIKSVAKTFDSLGSSPKNADKIRDAISEAWALSDDIGKEEYI